MYTFTTILCLTAIHRFHLVSGPQTAFRLVKIHGVIFCDLMINHPYTVDVHVDNYVCVYTCTRWSALSISSACPYSCAYAPLIILGTAT